MTLSDLIEHAGTSLVAHRLRATLSAIGVVFGVATVVAILGADLARALYGSADPIGHRVQASPGATALEGLGLMVDPVAKKLIPRDLLALGHRR